MTRILNSKIFKVIKHTVIIIFAASYVIPMFPFENQVIPWFLLIMALVGYILNEWVKEIFNSHIFGFLEIPITQYFTSTETKILSAIKIISFTFFTLFVGISTSTVFIKMDYEVLNKHDPKANEMFLYISIVLIFMYGFLIMYYWVCSIMRKWIDFFRMFYLPANSKNRDEFESHWKDIIHLMGGGKNSI